jgi:hypothetical protein
MNRNTITMNGKLLAVAIGVMLATGCSTLKDMGDELADNYYSKEMPTLESIQASKNKTQSHMGVAFYESDFKVDGQPKGLRDYNFLAESAPCTVLGDAYRGQIGQDDFYHVNVNGSSEVLVFNCRYQSDRSTENRLFLMGTFYECENRTWGYEWSALPEMKRYSRMCTKGMETQENEKISALYKKFNSPG